MSVKIDSLKELSKSIPLKPSKAVRIKRDKIIINFRKLVYCIQGQLYTSSLCMRSLTMTGSHTDSYCMTTSFLPPTCSLRLWFSQQHWFKRCCTSLVQWNINRKTKKKLDQTPASLINDILMQLSTLHYLKGLWWQWEWSSRVYYLGDQSRADIGQWVEWQLCPGDKWTRVRHRGTWACGEGGTRGQMGPI